jgi:superfamily II DNA helicase RecQ
MGRDFDSTSVAKTIFNCVAELKIHFGVNYTAAVLVGSNLQKILDHKHDKLSSHGALKDYSFAQVKKFIEELIKDGYIFQTKDKYPVLFLLEKGKLALTSTDKVSLTQPDPELAKKFIVPGESIEKTLALYKAGKSVNEIAKERGLSQETVISHLAFGYQKGENVNIDQFVPAEKQALITQAFRKLGTDYLTPVKQSLGMQCSWEELKLVRAKLLRPAAA